jgi:cytochrome c peroxidase
MRRHGSSLALTLALTIIGCQPAMRYGNPTVRQTRSSSASVATPSRIDDSSTKFPVPAEYLWAEPNDKLMDPLVPIIFVSEAKNRVDWDKLTQFWTVAEAPPKPVDVARMVGGPSMLAVGLAVAGPVQKVVKIKVPLGLDDPTPHVPKGNQPTLAKWDIGKRLFFDKDILTDSTRAKQSCAGCHQPSHGFTANFIHPRNPPTLIDCVYNTSQFWDGRAGALEEVVQRTLDDERETPGVRPEERHAWSGVIARLRANPDYVKRFEKTFGTPPTQDAVGKALATYLRTILSGNSLQDRAEQSLRQRGGISPEPADYEKLLDEGVLKVLLGADEPKSKEEVAKELVVGYTLFHGRAGCSKCHSGRNYTDNAFHNIGEGDNALARPPENEIGRFAVLPPGLKDRRMIGAFKTPTLRALPRTAPYFHRGLRNDLFDAVRVHVRPQRLGPNIDLEIRERGLKEEEVHALVRFLRALDGDPVPDVVAGAK